MSEKFFQDNSTAAVVEAIEANLYAFGTTQFAKWSRMSVHDEAHLLWFISDIPSPMFNVVQRARLSSDNVDGIITEVQNRYAEQDLPLLWWVGPSSTPLELSRHLTAAGFVPSGETIGMGIDLQELDIPKQPQNLEIRPTRDRNSLLTFARTMCLGFQLSRTVLEHMIDQVVAMGYGTEGPLINYVGYLDGRPVATSSLYLDSGVAGIYNVSTLPAVRRRGIGTAVTMAPLIEATRRGYRFAILHSSAMAHPMYEQLGFDTYCYFHQYLWPAPTEQKNS